jgi:hypothetical protein
MPYNLSNNDTLSLMFPVKFWKFKLNDDETNRLKIINETYALNQINPRGIQQSNSGGWHSPNNFFRNPVFNKLNSKIIDIIESEILPQEYSLLDSVYKDDGDRSSRIPQSYIQNQRVVTRATISDGWVNINKRGHLNVEHTHTNFFLSCVFYLKVPSGEYPGYLTFKDPIPVRKHQGPLYGKKVDCVVVPEDGMLVVFPSWVGHAVTPHNQNEDRLSYSCNIKYPYLNEKEVE